jgi:hypothetical protein
MNCTGRGVVLCASSNPAATRAAPHRVRYRFRMTISTSSPSLSSSPPGHASRGRRHRYPELRAGGRRFGPRGRFRLCSVLVGHHRHRPARRSRARGAPPTRRRTCSAGSAASVRNRKRPSASTG